MENNKPQDLLYTDFVKFDIRVGTITDVETLPKSKKLLKLNVSFGPVIGNRTILAGIASSYNFASDLIDKQIVAVLNLAPREMMGIMSHGMLLAVHDNNNKVCLINPNLVDDGFVLDGSEVG